MQSILASSKSERRCEGAKRSSGVTKKQVGLLNGEPLGSPRHSIILVSNFFD